MNIQYLSIEQVYIIHERMLKIAGGRAGIRDFTLLHSAVERPKVTFAGTLLYKSLWLQAGALMQSLIKNHPFEDGNKRTGFFSTYIFLRQNGYKIVANQDDVVNFAIDVDIKKLSVDTIAVWLEKHSESR